MEDLTKNSKKSVYCQIQFLESISTDNSHAINSEGDVNFFDIVRDSIIYFDKSEDEVKSYRNNNPYVARLIKMDANGECNIDWQNVELKIDDYVESYAATDGKCDFSPILLVFQVKKQQRSINNLCLKYRTQYGLMVYDQDSFQEIGIALEDSGFAVKRNSQEGWSNLFGARTFPGNSLVVIDDYILKDTGLYKNNLYELLDVLLPVDIKIPFYITFFCGKNYNDQALKFKKITEKIKELRPKYFNEDCDSYGLLKVNIIEDGNNVFHDRVILTNYCWISCGSGFDLYNKSQKAKHSTNVSILYPFIQHHVKWVKDSYLDFLNDTRKVYFDAKKGDNKWSEGCLFENRLYMLREQDTDW